MFQFNCMLTNASSFRFWSTTQSWSWKFEHPADSSILEMRLQQRSIFTSACLPIRVFHYFYVIPCQEMCLVVENILTSIAGEACLKFLFHVIVLNVL
jgi:hypothetical protein